MAAITKKKRKRRGREKEGERGREGEERRGEKRGKELNTNWLLL